MDPVLKKLQEKNKTFQKHRKQERLEVLKQIPFVFILMVAYFGTFYFLLNTAENSFGITWRGLTKHVWFLAVMLSAGVGSVFFAGSIAYVVWVSKIAKTLGFKVSQVKSSLISFLLLSISFIFLFLGKIMHLKVILNNKEIAQFMTFGYRKAPGIVEIAFTFFNVIACVVFVSVFIFIIRLPFSAKRHALQIIEYSGKQK